MRKMRGNKTWMILLYVIFFFYLDTANDFHFNKNKLTFMSIIDMKNHALNPSVVTYEHDTRRLRHALPPPLSQLWTPHSNHGVCDPSTSPSPPLTTLF